MRLDGRFEPLTVVAEALCVVGLGLAAAGALFIRHRARTAVPRMAAGYQAYVVPFTVTGPSPWTPR